MVALPLLTAVIVVDLFTCSSCKFYIKKAGMHTHSESLFRRTARNKFANPLAFSWRVPRLVFISRMSLMMVHKCEDVVQPVYESP